MKRNREVEDDIDSDSKRPKLHHHHWLRYKQPGPISAFAGTQDESVIEDQLARAIGVALHSTGFSSATRRAMQSFVDLVSEHMQNFARHVFISMSHARRTQPIPHDFIRSLSQLGLYPRDLKLDLRPFADPVVTQLPYAESQDDIDSVILFRPAPSLENDRRSSSIKRQRWIPSQFPKLPALHTYRSTTSIPEREHDPRVIREKATRDGILAENSLRKLVAARQEQHIRVMEGENDADPLSGSRVDTRTKKQMSQAWLNTMRTILNEDKKGLLNYSSAGFGISGSNAVANATLNNEVETDTRLSSVVNYDRIHWRSGARAESGSL